ncbi:MAG: TRAP transporter large permease [Planctomycetota bacterium]|jgi:tripartite ATP-independent transporter DctM subunit|nr:TRAP transporter large permease [Planctomycetota bacterium]
MSVYPPIAVLLAALALGAPIYLTLLASGVVYFVTNPSVGTFVVPQLISAGIMKNTLLAIPFFIMSGVCMNRSGITRRLMRFSEVLTGHLPGGLAHVNILLSTLMGGLSGSNIADAAMEAKILVPDMVKRGFSPAYSSVVTAASALITPIIPPGIGMIMYAFIANVSVGKMFMAGMVPGLAMCLWEMIANHFISKRRGYRPLHGKRASAREIAGEGKNAILAVIFPFVLIFGIRFGIFTPTEGGAVAVLYALVIGGPIYREMSWRGLGGALVETVVASCNSLMIFACANVFAWFVTNEKISDHVAAFILSAVSTPTAFLLLFMAVVLFLGMFLDGTTMMIILVPLLLPVAENMGIDLIHFGIIYLLCSAIGNITPPVGLVMYTVCDITGVKIKDFTRECLPFYAVLIVNVVLMILVPATVTAIPNWIYGG